MNSKFLFTINHLPNLNKSIGNLKFLRSSILLNQNIKNISSTSSSSTLNSDKNNFNRLIIVKNKSKLEELLGKQTIVPLNYLQIRTLLRGGKGYSNFAHGRNKLNVSRYAYFWYTFLVGGIMFLLFFDFESYTLKNEEAYEKVSSSYAFKATKAKEISENSDNNQVTIEKDSDSEVDESEDESKDKKKPKISFRDRKIIQYENRIRQYSTPDKVFRYFATIKVWNEKLNDYEIFMQPDDFVRSLTYGVKQPEGLGLDSYNKFDPNMQKLETNLSEDCVFRHLSPQGLISFSDYIFLVTLLSTPNRHFEIAFQMFDLDGNGNIDPGEFEQLQTIIRNQTSLGQRHRDTHMTGSVIKENSTLNDYFFGKNRDQLLTAKKFSEFQKRLQAEVIRMEFEYCDLKERKSDGVKIISEESFCEMILAYAGFNSSKTKKMLKHISNIYNDEDMRGITLSDYEDFFKVLRCIHDIDVALKFYAIAGAPIDKSILKHVSKTVANVDLSDHVVEVIFNLFDENGDGKLSHREFIKVMKKRWMRGLQTPKDTGFVKFIEAVGSCSKEMIFS